MKNILINLTPSLLLLVLTFQGCTQNYLEIKPKSSIVELTTLEDYHALLDNIRVTNATTGLPQISADEYYLLNQEVLNSFFIVTQRNAYTWEPDIYQGTVPLDDWSILYEGILYANSVLEGLKGKTWNDTDKANKLRGRALFIRAHSHFNLLQTFAPAYDNQTADTDLGIPIRLASDVSEIEQRASVADSYNQIITDLREAAGLLPRELPVTHRYRPSKVAAMALFARIYLNMRNYEKAEKYADSCLTMYHTLIDYNTISQMEFIPFPMDADEVIYHTRQIENYNTSSGQQLFVKDYFGIDTNLLALYDKDDLRLKIFYHKTDEGHSIPKMGYAGRGLYPFTGLTTDEIYLIKAECSTRNDNPAVALQYLNALLEKRYRTGTFTPITSTGGILDKIKEERRKELVFRGLRWFDIIRYNKEGDNITLERNIGGKHYELPPNSPLYVFPIPDDEINLAGLKQNPR